MAHSIGKKISMIFLMSGLMALSACAKKDGSAVRVAGRNGAAQQGAPSGANGSTPTAIVGSCTNGASSVGKIFDPQYPHGGMDYRSTVVSFLSATLEQQYIGQISGDPYAPTGIDFQAQVKFDSNGQIAADQSQILISVFDSFVGTMDPVSGQAVQAYRIFFGKAAGGQLMNNGQFTVKFQDEYGEITLMGTYNPQSEYSSGTVSYVNYLNVNGGTPTSGQLGSFQIRSCGMF